MGEERRRQMMESIRRGRERADVLQELRREGWRFNGPWSAELEWIALVALIEAGRPDGLDDYTYVLAARSYLEELRRRLPGYWSDLYGERLEPWDARFRAATFEEET